MGRTGWLSTGCRFIPPRPIPPHARYTCGCLADLAAAGSAERLFRRALLDENEALAMREDEQKEVAELYRDPGFKVRGSPCAPSLPALASP